MIQVAVKFSFDAAHLLSGYEGKCKNLHGHTYKGEVVVKGELDSSGFIIDYTELKKIVDSVISSYDHAYLSAYFNAYSSQRSNMLITELLYKLGLKIKILHCDYTTTENIALSIFGDISSKLPEGLSVVKVRVAETDSTYAEVNVDGEDKVSGDRDF